MREDCRRHLGRRKFPEKERALAALVQLEGWTVAGVSSWARYQGSGGREGEGVPLGDALGVVSLGGRAQLGLCQIRGYVLGVFHGVVHRER